MYFPLTLLSFSSSIYWIGVFMNNMNDLNNWDYIKSTVTTDLDDTITIDPGQFDLDLSNMFSDSMDTITLTSDLYDNVHRITGPDADLEINGRSLTKTLDKIEARLGIIEDNPELEADWQELKKLGDQYRKLEQSIMEKLQTYNSLKD